MGFNRPAATITKGLVLSVTCLIASSGHAIAAPAANGDGLYYYYFDQRIPVTLDETELVITDVSRTGRAAVRDFVAGFGIEDADITPHAAPHTWVVRAPAWGVADAETTRQLVATMANEAEFFRMLDNGADLFVSPKLGVDLGPAHIADGVIVRFVEGTTPEQAEQIVGEFLDVQLLEADFAGMPDVYLFSTSSRDGFAVLEAANKLAERADTVYAEPQMQLPVQKSIIPNDPLFPLQWGLRNTGQSGGTPNIDVDADLAWDITPGFPNVIITILDDGVQQDHPDMNQIPGIDVTGQGTGGGPGGSCDNHGTAVAGTATAFFNNSTGVAGVAPGTLTISVKFSNSQPPCTGSGVFQPAAFANGLNQALGQGSRISNNSNSMGASSTVSNVYSTTRNAGMIHFASAGNSNSSTIAYPSSLTTVNSVGAINRNGNRAGFSNFGAGIGFTGPGQSIWTADRTGSAGYVSGSYTTIDGTSFSSPIVAGVAALVLSANPTLSVNDLQAILEANTKDLGSSGYDTIFGWGIPDADDAMNAALQTLSPPGNINLATPADGLAEVDPNSVLLFAWTTTPGANFYIFEIDDDSDFSSPAISFDTFDNINNVDLSALQTETEYFWRARPVNLVGEGTSNPDFRSFTTIGFTEPEDCLGDLSGDNVVDTTDLGILLGAFGASDVGDLNDDGITDTTDLGTLLGAFGTTCP